MFFSLCILEKILFSLHSSSKVKVNLEKRPTIVAELVALLLSTLSKLSYDGTCSIPRQNYSTGMMTVLSAVFGNSSLVSNVNAALLALVVYRSVLRYVGRPTQELLTTGGSTGMMTCPECCVLSWCSVNSSLVSNVKPHCWHW